MNPADSGLRKITPEESMFTTPHRAVKSNGAQPARPAPAEWQGPVASPPGSGQTGQMGIVKASGSVERKGDTLQSLAALKKSGTLTPVSAAPGAPPTPVAQPMSPPTSFNEPRGGRPGVAPGPAAQPSPSPAPARPEGKASSAQVKRNYPALAAALQTVGYSVSGFVATAVVGLDGTPIAQVAVDEMDISPLCAHLSSVIQGALLASGINRGSDCQQITITSNTQHILLRVLSKQKEVFQVLITSRETAPAESLDVLANVEAALISAL
jgi:predicted regulator of Ras-like GTPase activity (Roadblock/LC7/MglB family)